MTDRLSLTNALADADIDRPKAERIATEIFDAIHDNVATRADLRELQLRLEARFEAMERRIDGVVVRLGSLIVILTGVVLAAIRYLPRSRPSDLNREARGKPVCRPGPSLSIPSRSPTPRCGAASSCMRLTG